MMGLPTASTFDASCSRDSYRASSHYSFQSKFAENNPPMIEMTLLDDTPFSESFSEIIDVIGDTRKSVATFSDLTFNIDQITDIQELDSQWDDDEIDEIVVISPKASIMLPTVPEDNHSLNKVTSLSEFDFLDCTDFATNSSCTYFVKKRDTSQIYIMKPFRLMPSHTWPEELLILERIHEQDAPYLPRIRYKIFEEQSLFVLMDSHPAGNLLNYVLQDGPLSLQEVLFYATEIVESIAVLHDAGILHRDINPANVMINKGGHIVLTGFENARFESEGSTGTDQYSSRDSEYRAPEHLLEWACDRAVDCWGFGCILYFMSHGKHPFPFEAHSQTKAYKQILRGDIVFEPGYVETSVLDLMRKCLERNPRLRPTISDIKQHEVFATTDWKAVNERRVQPSYIPGCTYHEGYANFKGALPPLVTDTDVNDQDALDVDYRNSCLAKSVEVYSVQARHSVQNLLPKVFRSPSLDELKMEVNRCRLSDDICHSKLDCAPAMFRSPTYENICRQPGSATLSPEQRIALFWESLDKNLNADPPRNEGISTMVTSDAQSLSRPRKLRKQRSSVLSYTNSRLSQLISLSSLSSGTQNKLRKIRRPKSTPTFAADPDNDDGKTLGTAQLPRGIENIGSGIGFKYHAPIAMKSRSSICMNTTKSRTSHARLPILGLGLGLGLSNFGGSLLRSKWRGKEGTKQDIYGQTQRSQGQEDWCKQEPKRRKKRDDANGIRVLREDVEATTVEGQDVFRYGSTLSLVPNIRNLNLNAMSPATATDTTANNTPLLDLGALSASDRMHLNSDSLIELMRREAEDTLHEDLNRATLRLIAS